MKKCFFCGIIFFKRENWFHVFKKTFFVISQECFIAFLGRAMKSMTDKYWILELIITFLVTYLGCTIFEWINCRNSDGKPPVRGGWCYVCERNDCSFFHALRPYECMACFKTCANDERYQQHMKQIHGTHPYKCCVCNEKYQFLVEFKSHVELHTRVIDCPSCKQQFDGEQKFASHCHDQ